MSAPQDRPAECDIIMKGGITSGVVYPLAVCELARTYGFRNIGGTSAGAIAAALTAAAELGRGKPGGGFDRLGKLPEFLGQRLLSLFQPSRKTRPAFAVLLSFLGKDSKKKKVIRAIDRIVSFHWLAALLGMLLGMGLWGLLVLLPLWLAGGKAGPGLLPGMGIVAFVFALATALIYFVRSAWKALNENGFGLCNGQDRSKGTDLPLTPWLAEELNRTAVMDPEGKPLTFGDLWGDGHRIQQLDDPSLRKINLEVMTTSLTHGRPQRLPFSTKDLFFDPAELRKYFPESVVDWMEKHPWRSEKKDSFRDLVTLETPYRPLPAPWDFPVVVAVRMSLSFPGLISAVPLYGVDWSVSDNQTARVPRLDRCWFSDGGIGSNFPVHFFDGLLPSRPTFGINLRPFSEAQPQDLKDESANVDFPATAREEVLPTWTPIPDVLRFASTIINTMQNWVDNSQMRLPGYRDRVVHVMLSDEEGGMNLDMEKELIEKLSFRGREAGRKLSGFNWNGHRWTRYLTAMAQLHIRLGGMQKVYNDGFRSFLADYDCSHKPYARTVDWKGSAVDGTDSMMSVIEAWSRSKHGFRDGAPRPETELRIGPKR